MKLFNNYGNLLQGNTPAKPAAERRRGAGTAEDTSLWGGGAGRGGARLAPASVNNPTIQQPLKYPAAPPQSGATGGRGRARRRSRMRRSEAGRMKQETNGVSKNMRVRRTRVGEL